MVAASVQFDHPQTEALRVLNCLLRRQVCLYYTAGVGEVPVAGKWCQKPWLWSPERPQNMHAFPLHTGRHCINVLSPLTWRGENWFEAKRTADGKSSEGDDYGMI